MKTSELTGPALDWAVAKACGLVTVEVEGVLHLVNTRGQPSINFNPSTNWAEGGPIIEREKIFIIAPYRSATSWKAYKMEWDQPELPSYTEDGPTLLIAAMRCFVASKLGDEVDIPAELLG